MSDWQPAVVRDAEENRTHIVDNNPHEMHHRNLRERTELLAGKRLLVRPLQYPAEVTCGCGEPQLEVEAQSASAALPGWGSYGRATICSAQVLTD